ncbi:MAG: hypothetical protein MHMPM18_003150 [Marteilia pararefringens]
MNNIFASRFRRLELNVFSRILLLLRILLTLAIMAIGIVSFILGFGGTENLTLGIYYLHLGISISVAAILLASSILNQVYLYLLEPSTCCLLQQPLFLSSLLLEITLALLLITEPDVMLLVSANLTHRVLLIARIATVGLLVAIDVTLIVFMALKAKNKTSNRELSIRSKTVDAHSHGI